MSRKPTALLVLIFALCGCAEGGSRGSGISMSVFGNVVRVQTTAPATPAGDMTPAVGTPQPAGAGTDLQGIEVSIEGTQVRGTTDADGNFSIAGDFEGWVNLVFSLPNQGGEARASLNVPAAGMLTLHNVVLYTHSGDAVAETQAVQFDSIITGIDCPGQILTLVSSQRGPGDDDNYRLRLDSSTIVNGTGQQVPCAALQLNEQAAIDGFVDPEGSFYNATVTLQN